MPHYHQPRTQDADRHARHETLALYVLGDLSIRAAMATREHLSNCRDCRNRLPQIRAVIAALRATGEPAVQPAL